MSRRSDRSLVIAAQRGDRRARDEVARTCLPLVYNVVGRALGAEHETEDVVQETMLRVIRGLPELRQPESLRAWTLAIAVHQISTHQAGARQATDEAELGEAEESLVDEHFEDLSILRLQLSGQRRVLARAAGWLDPDHRTVLALWWQEAAGRLTRAELATALETDVPYAAVRVQRMRGQLERARAVVSALEARPRCPELAAVAELWPGEPSPLWRKRLDRHVRDCEVCSAAGAEAVPAERLLAGLGLVAVPMGLSGSMLAHPSAGLVRRLVHLGRANPVATSAAATVVVVGVTGAIAAAALTSSPVAPPPPTPAAQAIPTTTTTQPPTSVAVTSAPATKKPKVVVPVTAKPACDDGSTAASWADWPMPNPAGSGLPHQARYSVKNGVVRDEVTCLEWQNTTAEDSYAWKDAKEYCNTLQLDGGDWRLPTRIELTSIVDTTRDNPAVDPDAFPGTPPRYFWTSSPWAAGAGKAWIVNFYEGLASNNADQSAEYNVRCVRGESGSGGPDYATTSTQATDPGTGLVWQRHLSPAMSADHAESYCAKLGLGGHTWRLPSIKELATTVDDSQVSPAVNRKVFPDTAPDARYWSSTHSSPKPSARWQLNYEDGFITYRDAESGYVRCVR